MCLSIYIYIMFLSIYVYMYLSLYISIFNDDYRPNYNNVVPAQL